MTRHIGRLLHFAETALLRHGTQPRTIFFLAALSALDGFIPMLPAEAFVVALCILQPQRGKFIVMLFAVASALSAFLLALLLGTLSSSAVVGKLLFYAGLLGLMHYLPSRLVKWRRADASWKRWLQRRDSRFVAYCRRIRSLARQPNQAFTQSQRIS